MYPELFHIGPIPIRAFGVGLALTFLLSVYYIKRITERDNKSFELYLTFSYILIFGGVIGARLFFAILHWSDFSNNLGAIFNPFQSGQFGIAGLNLYGGVMMAILSAIIYAWFKKIPILDVFDYFAPTVGLGLGISRIGCFLNGCCFGTPTDLPWGVEFPVGSIPYSIFGAEHIHPAQIYSSLYGIMLFVGLHYLIKNRKFDGQVVAVLFMVEAIFRFLIEFVRYYEDAMWFEFAGLNPTYNQLVGVGLFLAGLIIYIVKSKMQKVQS